MDRHNIVEIAQEIQAGIKEYQILNPECKSQGKAEKYALGRVMRLGCGIFNPSIIDAMINLERSVYRVDTDLRL